MMQCNMGFVFCVGLISMVNGAVSDSLRLLYEFPNSNYTDIENVAVRSNGNLLLNLITQPSMYSLDVAETEPLPKLIYTFPDAGSLLGIAETSPDIFAVAVGNYSVLDFKGIKGSFSIWTVDFNTEPPAVKKVTDLSEAQSLNGMTSLEGSEDTVLVADSALGTVFSVNTMSGEHNIAIHNPALGPGSSGFALGVNGIHTAGNTLYFTNSAQGTFGSIPIDTDGTAIGDPMVITKSPPGSIYDDFVVDSNKDVYIATHPSSLIQITFPVNQSTVANSSELTQPTSVALGRGCEGTGTLYVVTAGSPPTNDSDAISGQVFAIKQG